VKMITGAILILNSAVLHCRHIQLGSDDESWSARGADVRCTLRSDQPPRVRLFTLRAEVTSPSAIKRR
jgi:hypothetical protein